jgi:hypothetical protein
MARRGILLGDMIGLNRDIELGRNIEMDRDIEMDSGKTDLCSRMHSYSGVEICSRQSTALPVQSSLNMFIARYARRPSSQTLIAVKSPVLSMSPGEIPYCHGNLASSQCSAPFQYLCPSQYLYPFQYLCPS